MKKSTLFLLALMALMALCSLAGAETLTAYGTSFESEATLLDLDAAGILVTDTAELKALLNQMPNLTEVHMYNSHLRVNQMDELFDGYPDIFFGWTITLYTHTVRTDATAFSTLHSHEGTAEDPFHNTRELRRLRFCKNLIALDIGHNSLTNLDFLTELPQLKVLILGANYYITSIEPLANLTELEYLELFSANVTDVTPLASLTKLRDLNLAYNQQLRDISPLYELPNLERFWCGHTLVPKEQRNAMEAAHPGCEFDWLNMPTDGTWRKHPHYDTIYQMFHDGVYMPFDADAKEE